MFRSIALLALGSTLAGLPAPVVAQGDEPGWIGISYEVRPGEERRQRARVLVTDVREGSPAERAGLRPGDRLLRINDIRRTDEFADLPDRLRLSVGDRVTIRISRDGRSRTFRLRAAERPSELRASRPPDWSFPSDSVVETMVRAMDSVRVRLTETRTSTVRVLGSGQAPAEQRPRGTVRPSAGAPFEFFVFRGEDHDSLRLEMEEVERRLNELRALEGARLREISRAGRAARTRLNDDELVEVRSALEEVTRRSATLRAAMAEAARATAGLEYSYDASRAVARSRADEEPEIRPFRPLTPYLLGSNRVAGAQVVNLRPELAAYFAVERGVLIVDVAPGTPAAIAGLVPGDVVTRLHQVGVRSVEDLRFGVSQAGDTIPLTLVRRGDTLQVLLRRR